MSGGWLDGHAALITGGGTGIGRAVAERFLAEGASVTIMGRRKEQLDEVAAAASDPSRLHTVAGDVRDSESLLGCVALHIVWADMAELKSLAVSEAVQGRGVGSLLVRAGASSEGPSQQRELRGAPDPERYPMLAAAAAAWTAAHDHDTYRDDLEALIDALLANACHT